MEKEYVKYEQAIALKELGLDEPCLAVYNNPEFMWARHLKGWEDHELDNVTNSIYAEGGFVTAPTFSQAFRWFREKYDISSYVDYYENSEKDKIWYFIIKDKDSESQFDGSDKTEYCDVPYFKTYEELESACLDKLIEICKNK